MENPEPAEIAQQNLFSQILEEDSEDSTSIESRISRDETHLAVYPIALLSYQPQPGSIIERTRVVRHRKTKKRIEATWRVSGDAELGLPTPADNDVLLVLLELSREQRFADRVHFSRFELLKRLKWGMSSKEYKKLELSLQRLSHTTISSQNVFWNKQLEQYAQGTYHIFSLILYPEDRTRRRSVQKPPSYIEWSNLFVNSFRDGNLKALDLELVFSLKRPISKALYRLLDAVRYDGKKQYEIGVRKLCEDFLNMSPTKYESKHLHSLKPAHDELIEHGILSAVDVEEAKTFDGQKLIYRFAGVAELPPAQYANLDLYLPTVLRMAAPPPLSPESIDALRQDFAILSEIEWIELKRRALNYRPG